MNALLELSRGLDAQLIALLLSVPRMYAFLEASQLLSNSVVPNVRLAQALYAEADVNQYVPDELFEAIAEVLAWVKKNEHLLYRGRLRHGVIDMDMGDHRNEPEGGPFGPDVT